MRKRNKTKPTPYPRQRTHPAIMGCGGDGKPNIVIDGNRIMEYVGIGWIHIRDATPADRLRYPELTG